MKRKNGFYWVDNGDNISDWIIAKWTNDHWTVSGNDNLFLDVDFTKIDETQLIHLKP